MDNFISKVKKLPSQISHGAQSAFTPFKKHQKDNAKRIKLQKDLFAFTRCTENGFPHRANAIAHDPQLNLLAVGTKVGHVRIYGAPGVEFSSRVCAAESELEVRKLLFVNGEARLLALCADNSVHLLEVNSDTETQLGYLEDVKHVAFASKEVAPSSYLTALCLSSDATQLYCGTEGGSLMAINTKDFVHDEQFTVTYEQLTEKLSEACVKECSAVRTIAVRDSTMLIAFANGLAVHFDVASKKVLHAYFAAQTIEHLHWYAPTHFVTAHADGSYVKWSLHAAPAPEEQVEIVTVHKPTHPPTMPYGPYACNAMKKIVHAASKKGDYVIFADGMSSAQYGDKSTLTVMCEGDHVAFDFTSKLVDFVVLGDEHTHSHTHDNPHTLVVLLEEELLALDLEDARWRLLQNPYVHTMHSSAITCAHHFTNLKESLWNQLVELGKKQTDEIYSDREWPIRGGMLLPSSVPTKQKETEPAVAAEKEKEKEPPAAPTAEEVAAENKENEAPKADDKDKATEETTAKPTESETTQPKVATVVAPAAVLRRDVFVTGHEDGSILFWSAGEPAIKPLYKLTTSKLFADYFGAPEEREHADAAAQDWPPFRKVGMFDPFSDDPRLAVQRVLLNESTDELIVGGTAGQLIVLAMHADARELHVVDSKSDKTQTEAPAAAEAANATDTKPPHTEADPNAIKVIRCDFVEADGTFVWKGHDALKLVESDTTLAFGPGYQPRIVVQLHPPVPISALDVHPGWHLAALGTAHGYAVIDLVRAVPLKAQTTLTPTTTQHTAGPEGATEQPPAAVANQGGKIATLRRTIRDSFRAPVRQVRRVFKRADDGTKKRDSKKDTKKDETGPSNVPAVTVTEPTAEPDMTASTTQPPTIVEEAPTEQAAAAPSTEVSAEATEPAAETATQAPPDVTITASAQQEAAAETTEVPAEQQPATEKLEEKPCTTEVPQTEAEADKGKQVDSSAKTACYLTPEMRSTALVRFLSFAETFVSDEKHAPAATLWIGTNGGTVHLCTFTIKDGKLSDVEAAKRDTVQCELAKTLQLQHAAPIVFLALLDRSYVPLAYSTSEKVNEGHHRLLVCTEEQFKVFNAVTLKPKVKAKLHAPNRSRRCAIAKFVSCTNERYSEFALVSLSSEGQLIVSDLRNLRRQLVVDDTLPRGDLVALNSCLFTSDAHGIYQCSPSEFATFSLSARYANAPRCTVQPTSGVRPLKTKPSVVPRVTVGETLCAATATSQPAAAVSAEQPAAASTEAHTPSVAGEQNVAASSVEGGLADDITREMAKREVNLDKSVDLNVTETEHEKSRTLPTDITMDIIVDYTKGKQIDDDPKKEVLAEHSEHEAQVVS